MNNNNLPTAKTKVVSEKEVEEKDEPIKNNLTPKSNETANSGAAIAFFIIITTIFTIIIYATLPNDSTIYENNSNTNLYVLIYVLIIVVGNYLINLNITKSVCGEPQWAQTLINTIIPWIVIFGLLNICLIIFPGWISPFANTIGFGVINILGLSSLLDNLLNRINPDSKTNPLNDLVARGIQEIYGNNSLFINQIPTNSEEFKKFVTILEETGYFVKGLNTSSKSIIQLFKFLQLKELIGKYVWNLLTGILVTSVSYNFIINSQCDNSVKKLEENRNNFLLEEKKKQKTKENNRVYYPFVVGENNPDIDVKSSSYATTQT